MSIFIDDIRPCPDRFDDVARSSDKAIVMMEQDGCPRFISFDHDLGGDDTAMRVVNWMIEKDMDEPGWIPEPFNWDVHSANPVGKENINSKLLCYMKHRTCTEKKRAVIQRINAMEQTLMDFFDPVIKRQQARLADAGDPMVDWEIDVDLSAVDEDGDILYSAVCFDPIDSKYSEGKTMDYLKCNHNERPHSIQPEQREHHGFMYHDLTDHSKQAHIYGASKTEEITSLRVELKIYDQFRQQGADLQKAIRLAKANLPAHAETRKLLTDLEVEPNVTIAAYLHDDDPDCRPEYAEMDEEIEAERHPGVEDPYEGVIKYFGIDDTGDMSAEMSARTEFLFTDIKSSLAVTFPLFE